MVASAKFLREKLGDYEYLRYMRKAKWKSRGVIDIDRADELYENKVCCELCGRKDKLRLDHCHKTGMSRGILCEPCNIGIGLLQDNPAILAKGIEYLGKVVYNN